MRIILIVALALAAAAPATAAPPPVKFRVTIEASRTSSWTFSRDSCGGTTAAGTETTRIFTPQPLVVGEGALRKPMHTGLTITVRSTRQASVSAPAPCRWDDGHCTVTFSLPVVVPCDQPYLSDTAACGTREEKIKAGAGFYLGYGEDPSELSVQLAIEQPFWSSSCQSWYGRAPRGTFGSVDISLQALLKRRVSVFSGTNNDFPSGEHAYPGLTGSTHGVWKIRFERMP